MKKIVLSLIVLSTLKIASSQSDARMKAISDSICSCLSKQDLSKIQNKNEADAAFVNCFTRHGAAVVDYAQSQKIDISDQEAMRSLGIEIGKQLLRDNCDAFTQLSVKMAEDDASGKTSELNGSTSGTLKKVDNKDFRYLVLQDGSSREYSFIWLHYFAGSEKFIEDAEKYVGKKMKIKWKETEVFLPRSKGYYKIREIVSIELPG